MDVMSRRIDFDRETIGPVPSVVLRTPVNWTAVAFFAALAGLHLTVAVLAFAAGRWEGYLSLVLATVFLVIAGAAARFRFEVAVLCSSRRLRLRTGVGRLGASRFVPFAAVRAVRVTTCDDAAPERSRIELLCRCEDIPCPPTPVPRLQALLLAMLLGVPLFSASQ